MGRTHLKLAILALGASLAGACATPAAEEPIAFVVVAPNAHVNLSQVRTRAWARDDSVLLEANHDAWYRAVLSGGCTRRGPPSAIGFVTASGDTVERGSRALIEGETCLVNSLDRIEPPPPGSRS
jgi:hypothetical protein